MLLATILFLAPATLAHSQAPATKRSAARHSAGAASTVPPNIPRVVGLSKALYALRYIDTKVGSGELAPPTVLGASRADSKIMFYTVQYTGWLAKNGTKFDSSFDHPGKDPIVFPVGTHRVIPGWDTGFEGMHVGGKRRLFIPWQLAYGEQGHPPVIPARADLIFDIELVGFSDTPPAPKAAPPTRNPAQPAPDSSISPSHNPEEGKPAQNPAGTATPDPAGSATPKPEADPAKPATPDSTATPPVHP